MENFHIVKTPTRVNIQQMTVILHLQAAQWFALCFMLCRRSDLGSLRTDDQYVVSLHLTQKRECATGWTDDVPQVRNKKAVKIVRQTRKKWWWVDLFRTAINYHGDYYTKDAWGNKKKAQYCWLLINWSLCHKRKAWSRERTWFNLKYKRAQLEIPL